MVGGIGTGMAHDRRRMLGIHVDIKERSSLPIFEQDAHGCIVAGGAGNGNVA